MNEHAPAASVRGNQELIVDPESNRTHSWRRRATPRLLVYLDT